MSRSKAMKTIERTINFKEFYDRHNGDRLKIEEKLEISRHVYDQLHAKYILNDGAVVSPDPDAKAVTVEGCVVPDDLVDFAGAYLAWGHGKQGGFTDAERKGVCESVGIHDEWFDSKEKKLLAAYRVFKEEGNVVTSKPFAPPALPSGSGDVQAALGGLMAALGGAVDPEKLRGMVDEEVERAISEQAPKVVHIKGLGDTKEVTGVVPREFERLLVLGSQRVNTLMVGPSGCGKTHVAGLVAEGLGLRFGHISVSAGMSEAQLTGWLLPTGDGGRFEYKAAPFVDFYENGGVYLIDEIDSGDANTLTFINAALANHSLAIPNRTDGHVVTRHPDFVCMAAANTYGHGADRVYVGRNQLDAATLDRFKAGTVTMGYDKNVEKALVTSEVLTWGHSMRKAVEKCKLRRIVSMRFLRDLSMLAEAAPKLYGSEKNWFAQLTDGWSPDEIKRVKEAA